MSFNQLAPTVPTVLNTSNCFVFGNTASGNALSVQQLGAGNVATFRTTTGATALFINPSGYVGIGTTNPTTTLQVQGGIITNSDAISNKRYSYQGGMSVGTNPSVTLTFGQYAFYAKVIAILRHLGNSNNVNTMVLEVQGGNTYGSLSSVAIALGTKNMFGGGNSYPWSPTVTTTATTVVLTPYQSDAGAGYSYDIFVELVTGTGGTLASITQASTVVKTFSY